jgi:hypothetical protein
MMRAMDQLLLMLLNLHNNPTGPDLFLIANLLDMQVSSQVLSLMGPRRDVMS